MSGFFAPDSKLAILLSRLADLVVLNLVFLLTCLPVVTIGGALTALYTLCFRMAEDREGGIVRGYLRAFRENFRQATPMWLLFLCGLLGNAACVALLPGSGLRFLFGALFALVALTAAYAFPWLSRFQNDTVTTIKNAFLLSAAYLPRSLVILALNLAPFAVLLLDTYTFLGLGLLWLTIWFSGTAYLNCLLLQKVFAPYLGTPQ